MAAWKALLYFSASVMFFLTQGLGMNLALANLNQIQGSIAATTTEAAWLSAAYMAPNVSLGILLVKVRMQFGVRALAKAAVISFVVASLLNLFISDLQSAIFVRFLSGIAAAPLATLGFLYMLEIFPPEKRGTVGLCLVTMNSMLGAPLTRLVSPTLIDYGGWRGLYTLEMSLALLVLPIIFLLPLTAPPRVKVIVRTDILSYMFIAIGYGCFAVALSVGRAYWWFEASWLGVVLVVAVASLCVAALVELNREHPLIDIRWLLTWRNVHIFGILLIFRLMTGEQSAVVMLWYQNIGLLFDQLQTLYLIILAFTVVGGFVCAALLNRGLSRSIQVVALMLLATGAFIDSQTTNLTRPEQMYLSQALIAMGSAMFIPPTLADFFNAAFAKGPAYIVTFFVVFMFTQVIGALVATASYGTFITIREKFHSNVLAEQIRLTNPIVADRVSALITPYAKVMGDPSLMNGEALTLLAAQVTREANVLAFGDAYLVAGSIAVAALIIMLGHLGLQAFALKFTRTSAAAPAAA
ncbi:MFS transporter [Phyllobacterium sp. 1468]|uniref:MFS transporter n=1 Tax=Phyllobacterium sp. 1468 TaxID=2817759 RepID=UPI00286AB0F5|nr:MFS transporter [Phyllobacterium sp. 1468]